MVRRSSATKKIQSFSDKFGMLMAVSGRYFLEVSAHVSKKIATKNFLEIKKTMKI